MPVIFYFLFFCKTFCKTFWPARPAEGLCKYQNAHLCGVWLRQSMDENEEVKLAETRHKLTFVSHAGEDKSFVKSLLKELLSDTNVATFFDDDMAMGTPSEHEMTSRAAEADQAIVVLSRPFLTKEWPMKELAIFLKNRVDIFPLFYKVNPDELWDILGVYDR